MLRLLKQFYNSLKEFHNFVFLRLIIKNKCSIESTKYLNYKNYVDYIAFK